MKKETPQVLSKQKQGPTEQPANARKQSSDQSNQLAPQQCQDGILAKSYLNKSKSDMLDLLYSEEGDGEILIELDKQKRVLKLITCIDISTLYKEKRTKAIEMAQEFQRLYHPNLLNIISNFELLDNNGTLLFQTEAPDHIAGWKSYCKKKFTTDEMLCIFRQLCEALSYVHEVGLVHRDVHPTRIHSTHGIAKFNLIGMPYNYKKLLKKENFCGHVNYSAPELILEKAAFSSKVDIWSLGCCLYYLCTKKDPFEGRNPQEIKQNIMAGKLEKYPSKIDPVLKTLMHKCLEKDELKRLHAHEVIQFQDTLELQTYGRIKSTDIINKIRQKNRDQALDQQIKFSNGEAQEQEQTYLQPPSVPTNKYNNPSFFVSHKNVSENGDDTTPSKQQWYHYNRSSYEDYTPNNSHQQRKNLPYSERENNTSGKTQQQNQSMQKQQHHQNNYQQVHHRAKNVNRPGMQQQAYPDGTTSQEAAIKLKEQNASCKIQAYETHGQNGPALTLVKTKSSLANEVLGQPKNISVQDPSVPSDLTSHNLSQFNETSSKQGDSDRQTNMVSTQQQSTTESKEEYKNRYGTHSINDEENAENQPFSIFKNDYIFEGTNPKKTTNIEDSIIQKVIEDFVEKDGSEGQVNKVEAEDIVASIIGSSKRVKNQLHYYDGTKYVGEVMRHGQGIYYDQDGSIFDGQWYEDQKCGHGKMLFQDGAVFDGHWDSDKMHGQGVYISPNGDRYQGNFANGMKEGNGSIQYQNGDHYKGQWRNDTLWGSGVYTFQNGNIYEGCFSNGQFEGQGKMLFEGIGTYKGSFSGGNIAGTGRFEYLDGSVYEGEWWDNKKQGTGKFVEPNDHAVYNGNWDYDQKHGNGTFLQKGICSIEGTWKQGSLLEMTKYSTDL